MLTRDALKLDAAAAVAEIEKAIHAQVAGTLHRRGAVVGLSGGIDSSVVTTQRYARISDDLVRREVERVEFAMAN